jgi:hypothetical protein
VNGGKLMATEKRLIDANKVINSMQKCLDKSPDQKYTVAYFAFESIIAALKQEPTVDAVEVVRCKDCKHFSEDQYGCKCSFHSKKENENYPAFEVEMYPNDFCSHGERRDNGNRT